MKSKILQMAGDSKTLKVSMKTYMRLTKEGKAYGDTMNDIISRLLDEIDEARAHKPKK